MNSALLDDLIKKKALDQFDATRETFLVVENEALEDDVCTLIRCFKDQDTAIRFARAMANGNIDHRVLRVSGQTLVVATANEL